MKYSWSLTNVFFGQIHPGRGKKGQGAPSSKTSSSDRKTTATNRMHNNDLEACGKKCCYFWFHSQVKFLTRFDVFLDLVILAYFKVFSIDFYSVKCVITHLNDGMFFLFTS